MLMKIVSHPGHGNPKGFFSSELEEVQLPLFKLL